MELHSATSAGSVVRNPGTEALATIYNVSGSMEEFFREHINKLKSSDVPIQNRIGVILNQAVEGFGIGIGVSTAVIAVGQLILGNPLQAAITVASGAAFMNPTGASDALGGGIAAGAGLVGATLAINPIAITCGAIGAVVWGWGALSADEKEGILLRVSHLFEVGKELVRAIIEFVLRVSKAVFSDENLKQLLAFIEDIAQQFGKTLSDVTGRWIDRVSDAAAWVGRSAASVADGTVDNLDGASKRLQKVAGRVARMRKRSGGTP